MSDVQVEDPCGEFGPVQKRALVWFFAVLCIGSGLAYKLSCIDRWMYDNNGELLDYTAYRENRRAFTSIATESLDPRAQHASYSSVAGE